MFVLLINYIYNNQSSLSDTNQNNASKQHGMQCDAMNLRVEVGVVGPNGRGAIGMANWMTEWLDDWMTEWLNDWLSEWLNEQRTCLMCLWCCPLLSDCCMFGLSLLVWHLSVLGSALLWSYFFLLFFFWSSLALIDQLNSFVNNFLPTMMRHKEYRYIPQQRKPASSKSWEDLFGFLYLRGSRSICGPVKATTNTSRW